LLNPDRLTFFNKLLFDEESFREIIPRYDIITDLRFHNCVGVKLGFEDIFVVDFRFEYHVGLNFLPEENVGRTLVSD
jgi:hypothetical protein